MSHSLNMAYNYGKTRCVYDCKRQQQYAASIPFMRVCSMVSVSLPIISALARSLGQMYGAMLTERPSALPGRYGRAA